MITLTFRRTAWMLPAGAILAALTNGRALANSPYPQQDGAGKPPTSRSSTDAPIPAQGKLGQDLFISIGRGNIPGLKSLLQQGADPNARNGLQFTPLYLAAATGQTDAIEALLKGGAALDAASPYGTPLVFAAMSGAVPAINLLISKGANINAVRVDGASVLMFAARAGVADVVKDLINRKAPVNAKDNDGVTALTYAAREGRDEVGRVLLANGASVNSADNHGFTPLMYAAINAHPEFVKLLLDKGAKINAKDKQGCTALTLAAAYCNDRAVAEALINGGADKKVRDKAGKTAAAISLARGNTEFAMLLGEKPIPVAPIRTANEAVRLSLPILSHSMLEFNHRTGCISCHQDGLGRMATAEAREHGFAVDPAIEKAQSERINGALNALAPLHTAALKDPEAMKNVPLIEIGESVTGDAFMLAGMAAQKQTPTPAAGAMAMVMAKQQMPDGSWQFHLPRTPMQSSNFTFTALTIRSLKAYAPAADSPEIADRITKAKAWLLSAPVKTNEDRTFRLIGLMWSGATAEERQQAAKDLIDQQRPDGGWAQEDGLASDAYATGEALYSLTVAGGMPTSSTAFSQGSRFLIRNQDADGSWFVNKRAMPANNYFDAGFPHGQSQYSSFNGTCWAVMALLQATDAPHRKVAQRASIPLPASLSERLGEVR